MVSTRGIKARFTEGERVLCYEPDPTKAKVLYESKVLKIVHKESRGRKYIEYEIHFQGWNASWDRFVDEDLVLGDTEENRELQKRLMENAHIKLKEKKKKRRLSDTIREIVNEKEKQKKESDTRSQACTTDEDDTSLTSDQDSSSSSRSGSSGGGRRDSVTADTGGDGGSGVVVPAPPTVMGTAAAAALVGEEVYYKEFPIEIPAALKAVLERDQMLVKTKCKLLRLPSSPSVLLVLESYVVFFVSRYLARTSERRRNETKLKDKAYLTLDLCKEVMDGIRVCFDFHCTNHLLYDPEQQQADRLATASVRTAPPPSLQQHLNTMTGSSHLPAAVNGKEDKCRAVSCDDKGKADDAGGGGGSRRFTRSGVVRSSLPDTSTTTTTGGGAASESGRSTPLTVSSSVSSSQPPQSTADHAGAGGALPGGGGLVVGPYCHDLANWTLLPAAHRLPGTPVLLYGPMHLLRLFVKLPEILYRMNLPPEKRKIILKHIQLFLEYLDVHNQEYFSDTHYSPNNTSFGG